MALFENTFPPYVPFGSRNLSLRSQQLRGTDVAVFQAVYDLMLTTMNPPLGPIGSPITIDGIFGSASRQAAINIQSYFGLTADGIVGPNTFFLFGQGSTYGGPAFGSRTLTPGASGGDVTVLQNRLNTFRYSSIVSHPANGVYDDSTAAAVLAFKQDAIANGQTGLTMDSTVGYGTFDAFWLYTVMGGRGIMSGRNGFDVVALQVLLDHLGYYGGRFTGYYDPATIWAVRAFQTAVGIAVDGVVGQHTFYHLGLMNQVAAPSPLGIAWPVAPPVQVTECSVALQPTASGAGGTGVASIVARGGVETLDVVGNFLPDPSSFGPAYGQYAFTLTDPSTGMLIDQGLMDAVPLGSWAGSSTPALGVTKAVVSIVATPSGSLGPYGPTVANGNLQFCT